MLVRRRPADTGTQPTEHSARIHAIPPHINCYGRPAVGVLQTRERLTRVDLGTSGHADSQKWRSRTLLKTHTNGGKRVQWRESHSHVRNGLAPVVGLAERRAACAPSRERLEFLFREHQADVFGSSRFGWARWPMREIAFRSSAPGCWNAAIRWSTTTSSRCCMCARAMSRPTSCAAASTLHSRYAPNPKATMSRTVRRAWTAGRTSEQQLSLLLSLLDELPPKCRRAFVCYKLNGMEYREIAT